MTLDELRYDGDRALLAIMTHPVLVWLSDEQRKAIIAARALLAKDEAWAQKILDRMGNKEEKKKEDDSCSESDPTEA